MARELVSKRKKNKEDDITMNKSLNNRNSPIKTYRNPRSLILLLLTGFLLCGIVIFSLATQHTQIVSSARFEDRLKDFDLSARFHAYKVLNEYPHDPEAFTQSSVREVHLQTGEVKRLHRMKYADFGEGLTLLNERLLQLTWLTNVGYTYDQFNFSEVKRFQHPMKDGWGLANDGKNLFGSDGSSTMYYFDPVTFREKYRVTVKYEGIEVSHLNELEYINGEVWANVWQSDCIARISPKDGTVLGWILFHKLRKSLISSGYKNLDVLNGIAWDNREGRLFVTGKLWPKLYEVQLFPLRPQEIKNLVGIRQLCRLRDSSS
ncbi:glutaminyl-peptide cyclotransferase isoform X2 [Cryptomeria japonica]|uniref:glutaminyl-peptide cyclotransferase isoform X2 n=1 Tax=Cryptomeria japonica TaxID=3369 RepID=UPI0027DA2FFA|nr:glutaminyl-peptide cyclotransferase isoform X2 [Cryptomeria japonica]